MSLIGVPRWADDDGQAMTEPRRIDVNPRGRGLLAADFVLPDLLAWRRAGLKIALVSLVGIEGGTPRPLGAQMAVAEDGRHVGYLSGGCLEAAVALEAQSVIRDGANKHVRYGRGSPYFDITLPCGSGLDLYIDQALGTVELETMERLTAERRAFVLETDLITARKRIVDLAEDDRVEAERRGQVFRRRYVPNLKVVLVGAGPSVAAIAEIISAVGFDLVVATPDDVTRGEVCQMGLTPLGLTGPQIAGLEQLDRWSAVILSFHDHHWEPPLLAAALKSRCFYVGALGSKTVQTARLAKLLELGVSPEDTARIHGPAGVIQGAKARATLAIGIAAELMQSAKEHGYIA